MGRSQNPLGAECFASSTLTLWPTDQKADDCQRVSQWLDSRLKNSYKTQQGVATRVGSRM